MSGVLPVRPHRRAQPQRPAVYARLPKIHRDEPRTQGLDRLELIRFLQVAQTVSVHHGALAYLLGINALRHPRPRPCGSRTTARSSRYEHASLILTSNLPFNGRGSGFDDQAVAAAVIDRIVHHADVLTLKPELHR